MFGGLTVTATVEEQADFDPFGSSGHRLWFELSEEMIEAINDGSFGGGYGGGYGDIYLPGGSAATYADHLVVEDAKTGSVADYGKVETKLIGQSTHRPWTPTTIPVVRVDMDEFQPGLRLGGFEHFRLNNAVGLGGGSTGTMFREHVAHRVFRELYVGLRSSYAFLGSTVWGADTWVPMIFIEVYKRKFCEDNAELLGSETCPNMWEFYGDIGGGYYGGDYYGGGFYGGGYGDDACQLAECDNTRLEEASAAISAAPQGLGFAEAVSEYIDWELYYRFHCVSWILGVEDDAIRAGNNIVVLEREDGRLAWAPYSLDFSLQPNGFLPVTGNMTVPTKCQSDPDCWAGFYEECKETADEFIELGAEDFVDEAEDTLAEHGMTRRGDSGYADDVRAYLTQRKETLLADLERYRYLPDGEGQCPEGMQQCNDGTCGTPEDCEERVCYSGTSYCEALGYCIAPYEQCPNCQEEAPFWCAPAEQCMAGIESCSAYCAEHNGEGYEYCAAYGYCEVPEYCEGDADGGVGGPGGFGPGGFGPGGFGFGAGMGDPIPLPGPAFD
jgi:hypothetical protein